MEGRSYRLIWDSTFAWIDLGNPWKPVRAAGLWAKIWNQNFPNTRQEYWQLNRDVRCDA
jgi:hypothetical protein